ncbi:MAG: cyclic nucleotide-binding domain-containing protein [Methylococcales bacterium]
MSISITESDKKAFREMVPLSSFPHEKFEALCAMCRVHSGAPGTLLFRQGEMNNSFYFLLTGKVSFAIGDIPLETIAAGSPPARFALAHQFPRKVTATALTTIRFIRLDNDLLETGNPERRRTGGTTSKRVSGLQSITELLLPNWEPFSGSPCKTRNNEPNPATFKRLFRRVKRGSPHPNAADTARTDPSVPAETATHADWPITAGQHPIEPERPGIRLPNTSPTSVHNCEQAAIQETGWKRNLPLEIENQLQALLVPLMRNVSDISGSLVTTERGSFLSSEFPKHRIERIQAIVRAAITADRPEALEYPDETPEEILLRERNSLILIFLIGTQGLLALNANISANLGLIRLEAHPVVIQVGDIIAREAGTPSASSNGSHNHAS